MDELIYRIALVITGFLNLGMAVLLLIHTGQYKKYRIYRMTRNLTTIWLVAFGLGYMVHAAFFWRYTWPTAASALTASYFHVGALCFNWGYTSLLDNSYLKRSVIIRDLAIFVIGLIGYWTVAFLWDDAPTYVLISFCAFFLYAVLSITIFYRTYNRVSYRMLKMSMGSVGSFVRWMQVCCDLIIMFGVGSVAITGIFPNSLWPYVFLLFAGVGMFGYMVYSLERYGNVIEAATRATTFS
jgi:hypothetical protein